MYIHGSFYNRGNAKITVRIVTGGDRSVVLEIGDGRSGVWFGDDPVEIESQVDDTFDVLLRSQARVRLLTDRHLGMLYAQSCRDVSVGIWRDDVCLFAGYVEPMSLTQDYHSALDEVELTCIDSLCALEYSRYKDSGSAGVRYATLRKEAGVRTLWSILHEILLGVSAGWPSECGGLSVWYDGSKAVDDAAGHAYSLLEDLSMSDLLLLGDDEDSVWSQDTVVEELLKYANLHIRQEGTMYRIFSWDTLRKGGGRTWCELQSGRQAEVSDRRLAVVEGMVAGDGAQLSIGEVYNQLELTCKTETLDQAVESPLDGDALLSPYTTGLGYQKYMTELSCDGEGRAAYDGFDALVHDQPTNYGGGSVTDWYLQVKKHVHWKFPMGGGDGVDLVGHFCGSGKHQHALPDWLGSHVGAALVAWGSVKRQLATDDNRPVSSVSLTNYLVLTVNGNGVDQGEGALPNEATLKAGIPAAVYTGQGSGVFSPPDSDTTNYIVISGQLVLNPVMQETRNYTALHDERWDGVWHSTVPSRTNGDGRYYTRKYWQAERPEDAVTWHAGCDTGLYPYTGEGPDELPYTYSAVGDGSDRVSKVGLVACMLVIGDKCVVEVGGNGAPSDYRWVKYKDRTACSSDDEYYQQSFTIGIDPKIGDKLVGQEYSIQNNIDYTMGVAAEGTAIPIRKEDGVSGNLRFMILGPVNAVWDEVTRRHPTFFRHTKWTTTSRLILPHVSSILLKSFEMKILSDNGFFSGKDHDLVYVSDTEERFVHKKDDLEMRLSSALTRSERKALGVRSWVNLGTPVLTASGEGVLTLYDRNRGETAKAEQLYVDSYYREWHKPRVVLTQSLEDVADGVDGLARYDVGTLGKTFFVQSMDRLVEDNLAVLTLKEIDDD